VRPASVGNSGHGLFLGPLISTVAIPFELLMLALSELIYAAANALVLLVLRDSQRAEYLADEIDTACHRLALTRSTGPLEAELARERDLVSAETLQKYREKSLSELWQVDSTHPPTAMRVAMLGGVPQNGPAVQLSDEEGHRFDDEMSKLIAWRQREVMNRKLEAAYG
jgi:Zn-dependent protease with chaperone function